MAEDIPLTKKLRLDSTASEGSGDPEVLSQFLNDLDNLPDLSSLDGLAGNDTSGLVNSTLNANSSLSLQQQNVSNASVTLNPTQNHQRSNVSPSIPQSSGLLGGAVSQAPPTLQQTTPNTGALPGSTSGTPSLLGRTNMEGMTSNLFLGGNKLPPGAPPTLDPRQIINHYKDVGHNYQMVKPGLDIDDPQSNESKQLDPQKARQASIEKCNRALIHANQCRDPHCKQPSCIKMKEVLTHTRECKLMLARKWNQCVKCKQFVLLCISHSKICTDDACRVPLCPTIKKNLKKQQPNAKQALDEAMKAGFVRVNTTNILFFGMAGTGKTSTKHLLLGLPPPEDRNSTPLANTAERVCIRQIRDATKLKMEAEKDSPRTWKPIASDDLQRIVTDVIKSHVTSSNPNSVIPEELSIALKQLEPSNEPASNKPVDEIPSTSRASPTKLSDNEQESLYGGSRDFLKIISDVMINIQRFSVSDNDHTAIQEKFESHWIYIIDSGGQPHFHNLHC